MKNQKPLLTILILLIVFISSVYGMLATEDGQDLSVKEQARSDLIFIDSMKQYGNLERPVVPFPHDIHTEALKKQDKDCSACHLQDNNRMSLKFKHTAEMNKKDKMDLFHSACIGCHNDTAAARLTTGPRECGGCHLKTETPSSRTPMQFDKSLHFRHSRAQDNKCDACHHEYSEKEKKLVYVKGKEGSCRYCHTDNADKKILPMPAASHVACIDCHRKTIEQKKKSGPVTCHGCHDSATQKQYEKIKEVPRFDRNQPDQIFIKKGKEDKDGRMGRVAFDHLAHEAANDTCIQCHHKNLDACSSCHTIRGDKKGNWVKLEQAMHKVENQSGCMGCHRSRQQAIECSGCHASPRNIGTMDVAACQSCHQSTLSKADEKDPSVYSHEAAGRFLKNRVPITRTYADKDIPDKVMIDHLSDQYKPVEMPHRKIVHALTEGIKDDRLAGYFHKSEDTICRGCHHNSPASLQPPKCISCHGIQTAENNRVSRPNLMGAYHLQCMECHRNMGLTKLAGCTRCHEKK